jgi:hypothetical protein
MKVGEDDKMFWELCVVCGVLMRDVERKRSDAWVARVKSRLGFCLVPIYLGARKSTQREKGTCYRW